MIFPTFDPPKGKHKLIVFHIFPLQYTQSNPIIDHSEKGLSSASFFVSKTDPSLRFILKKKKKFNLEELRRRKMGK